MTIQRSNPTPGMGQPLVLGPSSAAERRAQIEHEQEILRAEREQQIEAQRSSMHTPEERIRLWERLHGLKLPRNSAHNLVLVIAKQTNLPLQAVHDEQARRLSAGK